MGCSLLLILLLVFMAAASDEIAQEMIDDDCLDVDVPLLTCLISISEGTFLNDTTGELHEEEHLVCIVIDEVNGRLGNDLRGIEHFIPEYDNIRQQNQLTIDKGQFFLRFRGVAEKDGLITNHACSSSRPWFERIDPPPPLVTRQRHLQEQQHSTTAGFGNKTLAMVRVMTLDSQPVYSAEELQDMVLNSDNDRVNVITQYRAMSFGQLELHPVGVYEVFVDQNASTFKSVVDMLGPIDAALMARYGKIIDNNPSELADYIFYCIPPGLQKGFIAYTSRWHWRSTYSDKFCASLGATIYEFGHQIGLGHSDEIAAGDYNDLACFMSMTGGKVDHPRQSFNGQKHWSLGWFQSRHLQVDPFQEFGTNNASINHGGGGAARLIDLATFVDFDKTTADQPVIVAIREDYYLQYNCAKGFNVDTRHVPNRVTVTAETGWQSSLRMAALDAVEETQYIHSNYNGSGSDLIIHVCEQVMGNELLPDVMRISIGLDTSACPADIPAAPTVSPRPTSVPTLEPSHEPSAFPSFQPSALPSTSPHPSASARPTHTPTVSLSPSMYPTVAPFTKVTHITPVATSTAAQKETKQLPSRCWLLLVSVLLISF